MNNKEDKCSCNKSYEKEKRITEETNRTIIMQNTIYNKSKENHEKYKLYLYIKTIVL